MRWTSVLNWLTVIIASSAEHCIEFLDFLQLSWTIDCTSSLFCIVLRKEFCKTFKNTVRKWNILNVYYDHFNCTIDTCIYVVSYTVKVGSYSCINFTGAKGKVDKKKPGKGSAKAKPAPPPTLSKTPLPADKASDVASDTKSIASETDSELMAEGIIPVTKQAVIG